MGWGYWQLLRTLEQEWSLLQEQLRLLQLPLDSAYTLIQDQTASARTPESFKQTTKLWLTIGMSYILRCSMEFGIVYFMVVLDLNAGLHYTMY